jgi:NitT/TauT family transport system substrate-binding protein
LFALALVLVLLVLPLGACGGDSSDDKVTIGLTFVPNVQFAPFYVAIEKGYYKDEGLKVELNHHQVGADEFGALVAGREDVLMGAGDEVLMAREKDAPLVYVAEIFTSYPVGLIVPADSDIQSVADLKGHSVGIPGEYGATYIGLLALLDSAGLTKNDVKIQSIGFTQAAALSSGQVDSVMGYVNNEPIQIEKAGVKTRVFPVSDVQPLVSNGLVTTEKQLEDHPEQVKKIVAATLKGVQYTIDHPDDAVEITKKYVPTLTDDEQVNDAKAVLAATIPLMQPGDAIGKSDPAAWQSMADFLLANGLLQQPADVGASFTNDEVP